jgi:hypothetical protein
LISFKISSKIFTQQGKYHLLIWLAIYFLMSINKIDLLNIFRGEGLVMSRKKPLLLNIFSEGRISSFVADTFIIHCLEFLASEQEESFVSVSLRDVLLPGSSRSMVEISYLYRRLSPTKEEVRCLRMVKKAILSTPKVRFTFAGLSRS